MNSASTTKLTMETLPIGRYIVDFPKGCHFESWAQKYCGIQEISYRRNVEKSKFFQSVEDRINELKSVVHMAGGTQLLEVRRNPTDPIVTIFYWENEMTKGDFINIDSYALIHDCIFKFKGSTETEAKRRDESTQWVEKKFRAIRPLNPFEVPTENGFCFDGFILVDPPGGSNREIVMARGLWEKHPDVHFSFATLTNVLSLDPPLLQRVGGFTFDFRTKVLRSGPRASACTRNGIQPA